MKPLKALACLPVIFAAWTTAAYAQDARPADIAPRAYFTGAGGAAFNRDFNDVAPAIAVEYGERVTRDVYAYANLRFVNDLMSEQMQFNLRTASEDTGLRFSGRDRGLSFTVGAKYMLPRAAQFRPYFGGGLGILNLKRRISEQTFGDVSEDFLVPYDGVIDAGRTSVTKPMGEVIVGFAGSLKNRTYLDVAYRHGWAFHSTQSLDFGQVTFALGVSF